MEFTQRELTLIAKAGKKPKNARNIRIILLIAMLLAVACMFVGVFDSDKLAYGLFIAVFVAIAHPQLGEGPKYEDLVALLEKKSAG
jgi:Zn-dependent protease with chaperone function